MFLHFCTLLIAATFARENVNDIFLIQKNYQSLVGCLGEPENMYYASRSGSCIADNLSSGIFTCVNATTGIYSRFADNDFRCEGEPIYETEISLGCSRSFFGSSFTECTTRFPFEPIFVLSAIFNSTTCSETAIPDLLNFLQPNTCGNFGKDEPYMIFGCDPPTAEWFSDADCTKLIQQRTLNQTICQSNQSTFYCDSLSKSGV
jgi:hypothetical protein